MTPEKTSAWFAQHARDVRRLIALAEQSAGQHPSKEFASTIVDLKILADLAEYHSRRVLAGLSFALFEKTHDLNMLDDAIQHEGEAVNAWAKIVNGCWRRLQLRSNDGPAAIRPERPLARRTCKAQGRP